MDVAPNPDEREPGVGRPRSTETSNFGVGRREGHDASGFYKRFVPPVISDDDTVVPASTVDRIWCGDARNLDAVGDVADNSVALVVTSPPYFAGKAYEEAMGEGGIPADYAEYLAMLTDVFRACVAKLEPGGRIAVNVANLGRKPYRSLSSDVIGIFEELGLLLRGEIIWQKGKGAGGSCAWGSFQRPGNPVLRDVTERVIVASKGRFDRAVDARSRAARDLPSTGSITVDDFLDATLDVWELAPESARRVNHPAPFPVELPQRLIELYTYAGDLVLDPFMGAGSSAVAAVRTGRHYVGFDTDPDYVAAAEARVAHERASASPVVVAPTREPRPEGDDVVATRTQGRKAVELAEAVLRAAGCVDVTDRIGIRGLPVDVDLRAAGPDGTEHLVLVAGTFTTGLAGLRRSDVLHRTLATAAVLRATGRREPLLVLTTALPSSGSTQARALDAVVGGDIAAVVDLSSDAAVDDTAAALAATDT